MRQIVGTLEHYLNVSVFYTCRTEVEIFILGTTILLTILHTSFHYIYPKLIGIVAIILFPMHTNYSMVAPKSSQMGRVSINPLQYGERTPFQSLRTVVDALLPG